MSTGAGANGLEAQIRRDLAACLLPHPKHVEATGGAVRLTDDWPLYVPDRLEPPETEALGRFRDLCADRAGLRLRTRRRESGRLPRGISIGLAERVGAATKVSQPGTNAERAAQGYRLRVAPDRVELVGASPSGLFHGVQTLRQLLLAFGRHWPCLEIHDVPDFAVRGLSHDVSRGKVPTLETLKELADRLAAFKINQLQLYVEHAFAFQFNPNIGRGCSPLTADDIRELDAHCARRRIELVPSLASFGHMGFILSLPEYRHLAEIEATVTWAEMSWRQRMHGLTLDPTNDGSRELLTRMYDEFLPLFSSGRVNVCCDETHDLGKGRNRARAAESGVGCLYLGHVRWLRELCRRHGKHMMLWGDVIKKHPAWIDELPKDAIVLNWGYAADADYDSTALFRDAGLTTYVCPGTSAWNRVMNDINTAELNIRRYAAAGVKYGAAGLLNTDWGDEGHFNLLAGSWHPVVLGAAMAWNAVGPPPGVFDHAFGRLVFDDESGALVRTLRRVVGASNLVRSWPAFCEPLAETVPEDEWTDQRVDHWHTMSLAAADEFAAHAATGSRVAQDMRELEIACRMNALVADRIRISRALAAATVDRVLADRLRKFAADYETLAPLYEDVWMARNRRSKLDEILVVFRCLAVEARTAAGE